MGVKLSNNFYLLEFLKSNTALRRRYNEQFTPDCDVIENLNKLCDELLQPLRDEVCRRHPDSKISIKITSGYRCPRLNKAIGGSQRSYHSFGMAGDCELYIDGIESNRILFDIFLEMELPFAECIYEYGSYDISTKKGSPDWVHLAYNKGRNKCKVKRAVRGKTKTVYKRWK